MLTSAINALRKNEKFQKIMDPIDKPFNDWQPTYGKSASCNDMLILGNHAKPPKYYLENNSPKGILIDIMKYVESETDYSFNIRLYPWKRAYMKAIDGKGGIIGLSKNSERIKLFDYSDVMYYDDLMILVLKGHEFVFHSIEDLSGKTLGVQRGASYGYEFEKGKGTIFKIDKDNNAIHRLKKLLAKRIDVALVGPGKIGVHLVIKQDNELLRRKNEFVILPKPFNRDPNFLGFSKRMNKGEFLKDFNQALEKGRQTGVIQKIIESYEVQFGVPNL